VLDRPYLRLELVLVNGPAIKVLIEKEFGDGIMSAIDFDMRARMYDDCRKRVLLMTGALSSEVGDHLEPIMHLK
jgi:cyanate lyase